MAGAVHAEKQRPDVLREIVPPVARSATLTVGHAFDPAEAEADRVADTVIARLRADSADAHEHAGTCEHGVQRSSAPAAAAEVGREGGALSAGLTADIESQRGRGSALPAGVRRRMESAFGHELGDVSIHTGDKAARLSSAVSAKAFTTGNDIFFGAGQFRPDTPAGEHMLAHELAHTQQQGRGIGRKTIHRWWDLSQEKVDWTRATEIRTLKTRFVWFVKDSEGDEMVVKLENQPVGLGQLAGEMHMSMGTAASVLQKRLTGRDKAWISQMLQTPAVSAGDSWGKFADNNKAFKAVGLPDGGVTDANKDQYGRMMALHELRESKDDLLGMSVAAGKSAEESAKPNTPGNGAKDDTVLRNRLETNGHPRQLGRITAVDLFLGNKDRVFRGNMGNWFYDPRGATTLIDHVDQGTGMAGKFAKATPFDKWSVGASKENPDGAGALLADGAIDSTVSEALGEIAREANFHGDKGFKKWLDEDTGSGTRRAKIEAEMAAGIREEKKKLVKVFTSTRFTIGGKQNRQQKKELKAIAQQASADDANHRTFGGQGNDYYAVLKERAAWLKSH